MSSASSMAPLDRLHGRFDVHYRNIVKTLCLGALAVLGLASPLPSALGANQKPNILYIVSDDQGWKDVGFHGSDIRTPALDKLAQSGARLEAFYAQPMCTPTRGALMTGRYPFRYGLQTLVIPSSHTYGLPTDEWLLPQALNEAGYATAIVGKWHLGHADPKYWPRQRGFDFQYGPLIGEIDYFTHEQHHVVDWYRNNKKLKEKGYSTILLGNAAVKLIPSRLGAEAPQRVAAPRPGETPRIQDVDRHVSAIRRLEDLPHPILEIALRESCRQLIVETTHAQGLFKKRGFKTLRKRTEHVIAMDVMSLPLKFQGK